MRRFLRFLLVMLPFALFAGTYGLLSLHPNYEVNPIDTEGVYQLEKRLFGIADGGGQVLIPSEFYQLHHQTGLDIFAGLCYLLWVPLPVAFAVYLFFAGKPRKALRFASCFLFVNLIGFAGYYIHPSAPPWYVMQYGFVADVHTPGNVAGFAYFDQLLHVPVFHAIYARNGNVFAAIPSLHVAYNVVALFYARQRPRAPRAWTVALAVVSAGICFAAVYSSHHYVIDVLLGLLTAAVGICLFECAVRWVGRKAAASPSTRQADRAE